jgi:ABC-type dipeptide/oligopeptide/nickel transport system permease component
VLGFILKRLLLLVPILFGVTLVVFAAVHLVPGDPALLMLGEKATPAALEALRRDLGLDKPLVVQYMTFLGHLVQGDLGRSVQTGNAVGWEIWDRFPATLELSVAALAIAVGLGVPLGLIAAVRRNSAADYLAMSGSLLGVSMPIFWLGLVLMMIFSAWLGWLPFSQRADILVTTPRVTGLLLVDTLVDKDAWAFGDALAHLVLPAFTLATVPMAVIARMTRGAMVEVLSSDYIRMARAKGLSEWRVNVHHALKNAAIPIVTITGLQFGMLLSGAILTETIFAWPGIGSLSVGAIFTRDFPVLQGCAVLFAASFVLVNLATDVLYTILDPRLRAGG